MSILKKIDPLLGLVAMLVSTLAYVFTTFATRAYVDERHAEAIEHSDQNFVKNREPLLEMRETLKIIDQRTYDMNGRRGLPPVEPILKGSR